MKKIKQNLPWLLLNINENIYAVSCENVLSLYQVDKITSLPKSPNEIRGVVKFRDQIIQLVDIRKILNVKGIDEDIREFEELMEARRNDHIKWLNTLDDCVKNEKEFTLTTNPHKCAFGKWYDTYRSNNTNLMFLMTFARFNNPHLEIHAIGDKAKELIDKNDRKGAIALVEATRNTVLMKMMMLFDEIKQAYRESKREILVIIGDTTRSIGIAVDEIVAIEHLSELDEDMLKSTITKTEYLMGTGKRKDDSVVFLLNDDYFLDTFLNKTETKTVPEETIN